MYICSTSLRHFNCISFWPINVYNWTIILLVYHQIICFVTASMWRPIFIIAVLLDLLNKCGVITTNCLHDDQLLRNCSNFQTTLLQCMLLCLPSVHRGGDILLYLCPLSLSQSVSVSHSFRSSAFYGTGGQHKTLTQCWDNVGTPSTTLTQH